MLLRSVAAGKDLMVREIDIDAAGGEVLSAFEARVPVVKLPGGKELDLWIDPVELEILLREVRG